MEKIKLWDNGTPYYDPALGQEETTLTPYLVKDGRKDKGLVIVCPGGGYAGRADHEGEPVAKMLNAAGISAVVLNYRVAPYRHPAPLTDANRAVRFVRYHAAAWEIDPKKIGILGFSAGGHLAVSACEHFDAGLVDGDEIDKESSRPDAGIFCYPVVTFHKPFAHIGSRNNLLGDEENKELDDLLTGEDNVPDDCPPCFLWHTAEDNGVPVENSLMLSAALSKKKIPFELHIFPKGWHGLGLAENNESVRQWAPLLVKWLKGYGF